MGAFNFQFGMVDEVTFNTPLTVTRFHEYTGDTMPIKSIAGRTEGNPMRGPSRARRSARTVPYFDHAEGHIDMELLDKGFGIWLKHMLPSVASSGSGPFVYTATEGSTNPIGKSFTAQVNVPFNPTGTDQAFTYSGGKVTKWSVSNAVDKMLVVGLDLWFASMATGTALATASYPSSPNPFSWVGAVVNIGGSAFDCTDIEINCDLGLNVDTAQLRGTALKKEPRPGVIATDWKIEADFDSLAQYNRVHAATVAGISAAITSTWTNGTSSLAVTMPAARFDEFEHAGDPGNATQSFNGIAEYDGTASSPIQVVYTTSDSTP